MIKKNKIHHFFLNRKYFKNIIMEGDKSEIINSKICNTCGGKVDTIGHPLYENVLLFLNN